MGGHDLRHVGDLLGERIAFHRHLAQITGSAKTGLLLSQALYWTRVGEAIVEHQGWFHKTIAQWSHETGLSRREQQSTRHRLSALGLMEEDLRGQPAKLWFRVDLVRLGEALAHMSDTRTPLLTLQALRTPSLKWVRQILGPIVVFHRRLAQITGGVHSALLLSRHLEASRSRARVRESASWLLPSQSRLQDDTGMSRRELEHARAQLREADFIEERRCGVPPVVAVRVMLPAIAAAAHEKGLTFRFGAVLHESAILDCGDPTIKTKAIPQSSMAESAKSGCAKAPNQDAQKVHNCSADSCELSKQETTTALFTTTPTPIDPTLPRTPSAMASEEWAFPQGIHPEEQSLCRVLLAGSADPQRLLDELDGHMTNPARNTPIASPLGYLRTLRWREVKGVFVPTFAHQVRRKREAAQRAEQLQRAAAATPPTQSEPRRPMPEAVRQMLAAFSGRRAA